MKIYNKDTVCVMPFLSIYADPTGHLAPCCMGKPFKEKPFFNDFDSIDELRNSAPYRRIRKEMLEGIEPEECEVCFKHKANFMKDQNRIMGHLMDPIESLFTDDFKTSKLVYIDFRFSNICNLSCRMCSFGLSSTWYDNHEKIYEFDEQGIAEHRSKYPSKFISLGGKPVDKLTESNLDSIRHVYLAGGEPFVMQDTFDLFDKFSDEQKSKITLTINSNLSTLSFKGREVLPEFDKFFRVNLFGSVDGYGKVGEYQRVHFKSERFFKNLQKAVEFQSTRPHINVSLDFTMSAINLFHFFDFVNYSRKYVSNISSYMVKPVFYPYYFSPGVLPDEIKTKALNHFEEELSKLESEHTTEEEKEQFQIFKNHFSLVQSHIESSFKPEVFLNLVQHRGFNNLDFEKVIKNMDDTWNTDYREVCPWVESLFDRNLQPRINKLKELL